MCGVYGHVLLEHLSDSYDYLEELKKLDKKQIHMMSFQISKIK